MFEIWLRSPDVEIAEPDNAGRFDEVKERIADSGVGVRGEVRAGDCEGRARAGLESRDEADLPRFSRGEEEGLVIQCAL